MIRLIFVETDAGPMMGGAPVGSVIHKGFDVELPEVEAWLGEPAKEKWTYVTRSFVGIEILPNRVAELKAYVQELEDKLAAVEAKKEQDESVERCGA